MMDSQHPSNEEMSCKCFIHFGTTFQVFGSIQVGLNISKCKKYKTCMRLCDCVRLGRSRHLASKRNASFCVVVFIRDVAEIKYRAPRTLVPGSVNIFNVTVMASRVREETEEQSPRTAQHRGKRR